MSPGPVDRIRALDGRWREAAVRHDLDAMMSIYAEDARELLPGMPPIVGIEAIREFYAGLIEEYPRFEHEFEIAEIIVTDSGDLAVTRGTYRFTPDGRRRDEYESGKYVGVWRKRDGEWRLYLNISNSGAAMSG